MADSIITKRALAAALRELMQEMPFDKIQVAHICDRCGMNRKSFYYHFKDKYDLLNWIFDIEIISFAQSISEVQRFEQRVEVVRDICNYFYENRQFYRVALKIKGQNSFSEHLREYTVPILKIRLTYLIGNDVDDFELNLFADIWMYAYFGEMPAIRESYTCCDRYMKCEEDGKEKPSEMWPASMVQGLVGEIKGKML